MIITKKFVLLNNPKTGSTFVRSVLKQIHEIPAHQNSRVVRTLQRWNVLKSPEIFELMLPNIKVPDARPRDQHGTFDQIPRLHSSKKIVSVVRDPFERLLSSYRYRWWVRFPPLAPPALQEEFPAFPELSLADYLRLEEIDARRRLPRQVRPPDVGVQTVQFIQMFFHDAAAVLQRLSDDYLDSDRFLDDMPAIQFLQTERLNRGLFELLRDQGYPDERIAFVLDQEPVNTTVQEGVRQEWSEDVVNRLLHTERLLFRILAHLGFRYDPPRPLAQSRSISSSSAPTNP